MDPKKLSIVSALLASSCCVLPLLLLGMTLLGIGTVGLAGASTVLGSLKWYLFPMAIVGLGLSYYLYFREKKKCATEACRMVNQRLTKSMLSLSTLVIVGFLLWSVYPYVLGTEALSASPPANPEHAVAILAVEGMTCGGCEIAVGEALRALAGVDSVRVSYPEERAVVWYGHAEVTVERFAAALDQVGYSAELIRTEKGTDPDDN